ncbi:FtsX-like permease family protein [Segatella copri]|uniref:ABC transporter permease n=1 Tax=Segatella copri TaxID=165179 RepID=UPI00293B6658|nr:FtsX-like permease family protein [Segatella copri]MDV3105061.1 FtsX-like permease family protein [Segatella copri]
MNHIINAFKNLPRRGQHNFVKILCLALGLAISSVIIAEIYFEQTYDTYFPEWERTYLISEVGSNHGEIMEFTNTSGAIAQGVKQYAPMVEAATSTHYFYDDAQCKMEDQNIVSANIRMADSCFFDVFPQKILIGKAKQILSQPLSCLIDSETAAKIGGNVVGKHFTLSNYPGTTFTIYGVFEAFPWGSSFHGTQMILSRCSVPYVYSYDGRDQWVGNDSYRSYIRLAKGHEAKELKPYVNKMREDHFPLKEMKNMGLELNYDFTVLSDVYTQDPYIKKMGWIMGIIAFVLLFTSVMNYLLIIVGNLVGRSREMAVRKCYGAEPKNIHAIIFSEALVHVGLAVVLAAVLVFLCKGTIENFLSAPVSTLVLNRGSWILVAICILVLLVGGLLPGWLYNKIPVAIAFRGYNENRNLWKLGLLGIQFVISGLLFSLLYIVNGQYQLMLGLNPGYDYDHVAIVSVDASNRDQRNQCLAEIRRMPNVKECSSTFNVPLDGYERSGNMVGVPGDEKNTFNIMEMSGVDDNFFKMMNIPIVQGSFFTERNDSCRQVIIDERGAEKLIKTWHWKDGVVGKQITCTGHDDNIFTICGVSRNIRWGAVATGSDGMNEFPDLYFYSAKTAYYMLVKFNEMKDESLSELQSKVQAMYPNNKVIVKSYASELANQYASQLNFRNGILVAGIVTMIIALFGLVGYTSDEVNRRRKEIAIRKVNGAKVKDILRIFLKDIMKIALPCIIVGDLGAWLIARQWLMSFSEKITMTPLLFIGVTIILLVIIGLSVIINCYKVANSNPVKYLKNE